MSVHALIALPRVSEITSSVWTSISSLEYADSSSEHRKRQVDVILTSLFLLLELGSRPSAAAAQPRDQASSLKAANAPFLSDHTRPGATVAQMTAPANNRS